MNTSRIILFSMLITTSLTTCKKEGSTKKIEFAYINSKNGLNLRKSPSKKGKKIMTIGLSEMVTIIEKKSKQVKIGKKKGSWVKVKYHGSKKTKTGWVFDAYLSTKRPKHPKDKFLGHWQGQWNCSNNKSESQNGEESTNLMDTDGISIYSDGTYNIRLFEGGDLGGCSLDNKAQGKYYLKSKKVICLLLDKKYFHEKEKETCYWIKKGKLITNEKNSGGLRQNYENDILTNLKLHSQLDEDE